MPQSPRHAGRLFAARVTRTEDALLSWTLEAELSGAANLCSVMFNPPGRWQRACMVGFARGMRRRVLSRPRLEPTDAVSEGAQYTHSKGQTGYALLFQ